MDESNVNKILYTLKEFNEELTYSRDTINKLNEYNITFVNKLISLNKELGDEETEFYTKLDSILLIIDQKKKIFSTNLDKALSKNTILFDSKLVSSKEMYDAEIRNISNDIDKQTASFEKEISNITNSTYYKTLETSHTRGEYDNFLDNIKNNYLSIISFFYDKKDQDLQNINNERTIAENELLETLKKINDVFEKEIKQINEEKQDNILKIKQRQSDKEKELFNKKVEINKKLDDTSTYYKDTITFMITPFKNHIDYLQENINSINIEEKNKELEILDEFKLNLELIDKELEVFKNNTLTNYEKLSERKKAIIDNKVSVYNETMRTKKLELDSEKSYKIKKLQLDSNYKRDVLNKNIELLQNKIKAIDSSYSLKEYISLSHIRHDMELDELSIKNDLDMIKQELYLLENQDKLNIEYFNTIHEYQIQLHNEASSFNDMFFTTIQNNINTLNSLEIEKNLILKKYNEDLNALLRKKLECSIAIIKLEESIDIKNKRNETEMRKKILSQDIQLANKKYTLQKILISREQEFFEQNIIDEERSTLENQTYKIFENRFALEKKLYEIYFKAIAEYIEIYSLYFDRYNSISRCTNKNITISTYDFLLTTLKASIDQLIERVVSVLTDRINFEGSINFQYELTKLISERDAVDTDFENSNNKMNETISNYKKTIELYKKNIEILDRDIYKTENSIALKNLDISKDSKLSSNIKAMSEVNTLKENITNFRKEQRNYTEIIQKNEKSIIELEKSITKNKKKYFKISATITEQLENIEKRHKAESSIYYKFIDKVQLFSKELSTSINQSEMENNVYKSYKKHISNMIIFANEFRNNELGKLISKLNYRHELLLDKSNVKNQDRILEVQDLYNLDVKNTCISYNNEVLEIEKKIEKINSNYEDNAKEIVSYYKEKYSDIKHTTKSLDIAITQQKAELLYDINSFTENIKDHAALNERNISELKYGRKNLPKEYYKQSEIFTNERKNKLNNIKFIHNNVLNSLKINYKNIVKEKVNNHTKKDSSYNSQISSINNTALNKLQEFDNYLVTSKIEYELASSTLEQALTNSLNLIRKRSLTKINKENKKRSKNTIN